MRELVFDLSDDNYLPKSGFGGFEGEHNATGIALLLPERLLAPDAVYYMVFETEKNGEVIFSAPLLPDENRIYATLPRQVMLAPRVSIHAAAYRKNGEELVEIAKSARAVLEIKYPEGETERELSTDGGEIPGLVIESALLPESENPVSSRALHGEFSSLAGEQVEQAFVNEAGELILKKKNRKELCAGAVVGPKGEQGPQGEQGIQGEKGERGEGAVYYKYDFNGDGEVNEDDVHRLLYCVNFSQAPEYRPSWWSDPDVNGDGVVGDEDVATLQNWLETGNEAAYAIAPKNELVDDSFSATSEKPIQNKAVSAGVANALKGQKSGTAVAMKDVSPLEHNIGVKLASKNLVDIKQMLNECLVDNGDGTFTYIRNASMVSAVFPLKLKAGTKIKSKAEIISSQNNTENSLCYRVNYADGGIKGYYLSDSKVTLEKDIVGLVIYSYEPNVSFVFKEWQLELGDTATAYTPFADVSTVTLKKCGKNLVDVSQMLNKNLADNGDGTFTYTRASSNYHSEAFPLKLKAGTTIALNMEQISTTDADDRLTCVFIYADGTSKSSYIGRGSATSFTTDKDVVRVQLFSYNAGTVFVFKNFQIELGTTASEYEIFKESVSYPVKKDGTVDGVTSLYPTTTLLTDTEGVIISAEYNRDVNKALADLEAKLQALILEV